MSPRSLHGARVAYALVALTVCGSAAFIGSGITTLLAEPNLPLERDPSDRRRRSFEPEGPGTEQLARQILTRNMFDSHTGPLSWDEPPPPESSDVAAAEPAVAPAEPARCQGELRLLGTVVLHRAPERSLAALRVGKETHVMRVGEAAAGVQLLAITPTFAYLAQDQARSCTLPLWLSAEERAELARRSAPPPAKKKKAKSPKKKKKKPPLFSDEELRAGIRAEGQGRFIVARSLLTQALGKVTNARQVGRFVPHMRQGRRLGMKVYGIERGSLLSQLGLRNGDVLRTLNGHDLASADGLLSAYTMVRQGESFSLALMRRGKPEFLEYRLDQ